MGGCVEFGFDQALLAPARASVSGGMGNERKAVNIGYIRQIDLLVTTPLD
jgi:hypothetical protein